MSVQHRSRSMLASLWVWALASLPATAGSVGLTWDPVSDPDLAGYRVYYGASPGGYSNPIDVGAATQYDVPGLANCTTWHFAVKAYDVAGLESETFSNEVVGWARPIVSGAAPSTAARGERLDITLSGNNFQAGATVEFSDPGIQIHSVSVGSCSQLVIDATVGAGATIGATDIEVINPGGVFGAGAGLFTVAPGNAPPGRVLNLRRSDARGN